MQQTELAVVPASSLDDRHQSDLGDLFGQLLGVLLSSSPVTGHLNSDCERRAYVGVNPFLSVDGWRALMRLRPVDQDPVDEDPVRHAEGK